jgi:antibiotic biosynthesis monooxygenase (ABM) superfamily enzyme
MYPPVRQLKRLRSPSTHSPRPTPALVGSPHSSPPPRHKLALLTWLGAYPVITLILALLGPAIVQWPLALRTLVMSVLMVVTLTWLVMPGLTRVLRPWLSRPAG